MLLSVVIPCFNKAEYLLELLDCCKNQSLTDWEVFLIDDGSTEDNYSLINNYAKGDSRIKLLKRDRLPKNGNTCRNIGLGKATGKYLIILDSDDLISKTCFYNRVLYMENHPELDYVSFPGRPFIGSLESSDNKYLKTRYGIKNNNRSIPFNLLNLEYPFTVWTNIYRTDKVRDILWDEKIYVMQDLDWMLSCHFSGLKHGYSDTAEYDYYYRQFVSGNNVCSDFSSPLKCNSTIYLCNKIKQKIDDYTAENLKKVYHKFVVRQFHRIIQGRDSETTSYFIEQCTFLDALTVKKMKKVSYHFLKKETRYDPLRLYLLLCIYINYRYYWREFLHSVIACLKGTKPIYFT